MISSKPLLHCRLDWRPSPLLQIMLFALMLLAILSVGISALVWYFSIPLGLLVVYTGAFKIRQERLRPHCSLFWRAGENVITLNFGRSSESLTEPRCHQQGPLWIISAMDGFRQKRHFVFLPDTITCSERRLLRLIAATPITLE